jgi:hypothetical protein
VSRVSSFFKVLRKMPHGRKEKRETKLVLRNIGRFLLDFHHQHGIFIGINSIEGRRSLIELIPKHHNHMARSLSPFFTHDPPPFRMLYSIVKPRTHSQAPCLLIRILRKISAV